MRFYLFSIFLIFFMSVISAIGCPGDLNADYINTTIVLDGNHFSDVSEDDYCIGIPEGVFGLDDYLEIECDLNWFVTPEDVIWFIDYNASDMNYIRLKNCFLSGVTSNDYLIRSLNPDAHIDNFILDNVRYSNGQLALFSGTIDDFNVINFDSNNYGADEVVVLGNVETLTFNNYNINTYDDQYGGDYIFSDIVGVNRLNILNSNIITDVNVNSVFYFEYSEDNGDITEVNVIPEIYISNSNILDYNISDVNLEETSLFMAFSYDGNNLLQNELNISVLDSNVTFFALGIDFYDSNRVLYIDSIDINASGSDINYFYFAVSSFDENNNKFYSNNINFSNINSKVVSRGLNLAFDYGNNVVDVNSITFTDSNIYVYNTFDAIMEGLIGAPFILLALGEGNANIDEINYLDSNIYLGDTSLFYNQLGVTLSDLDFNFYGSRVYGLGPSDVIEGMFGDFKFPMIGFLANFTNLNDGIATTPADVNNLNVYNLNYESELPLFGLLDYIPGMGWIGVSANVEHFNVYDSIIDINNALLVYVDGNYENSIDLNFNNSYITTNNDVFEFGYLHEAIYDSIQIQDLNLSSDSNIYLFRSSNGLVANNVLISDSEMQLDGLINLNAVSDFNSLIYNNIFTDINESNNQLLLIDNTEISIDFNIERTLSNNIIGNRYKGGNYWSNLTNTGFSDTCDDLDSDGICDTVFDLNSDVGSFIDYLPLGPYIGVVDLNAKSISASNVNSGQTVNVTFIYGNDGDANATEDYNITIALNGIQKCFTTISEDLNSGDSNTYTCSFTAPTVSNTTNYTLSAEIDYNGVDANSDNNYTSTTLRVSATSSSGGHSNEDPTAEITNVVVNEDDAMAYFGTDDVDGKIILCQYKLNDDSWEDVSCDSHTFNNLNDDDYKLYFKAKDNDDAWSNVANYSFKISKTTIIVDSNTDSNESNVIIDENKDINKTQIIDSQKTDSKSDIENQENITNNESEEISYSMKYKVKLGLDENQEVYVYSDDELLSKVNVIVLKDDYRYEGYTNDDGFVSFRLPVLGEYTLEINYKGNEIEGSFNVIENYISTEEDFIILSNNPEFVSETSNNSNSVLNYTLIGLIIVGVLGGLVYLFKVFVK